MHSRVYFAASAFLWPVSYALGFMDCPMSALSIGLIAYLTLLRAAHQHSANHCRLHVNPLWIVQRWFSNETAQPVSEATVLPTVQYGRSVVENQNHGAFASVECRQKGKVA